MPGTFTWLVPFAVASRHWGTRLVSLSAFVYFALPHQLAVGLSDWTLSSVQRFWLWGPFFCWDWPYRQGNEQDRLNTHRSSPSKTSYHSHLNFSFDEFHIKIVFSRSNSLNSSNNDEKTIFPHSTDACNRRDC